MTVTAAGRKIVAITARNRRFRPRKRNRENPYATSVHEATVPIMPITAMAIVLKSSFGYWISFQTFT